MGVFRHRPLGLQDSERRLRHPLLVESASGSTSPKFSCLPGKQGKVSCSSTGSNLPTGEMCHRGSLEPRTGVLQQIVPGCKSLGGVEASVRRVLPKQICEKDEILNGVGQNGPSGYSEGRLDVLIRFKGCLFSHPDTSRESQVPEVLPRRQGVSVSSNVFRPEHGASGVHESDVSFCENHTLSGLQDFALSGRLVSPSKEHRGNDKGIGLHIKPRKKVRFADKLEQIYSIPSTRGRVSGNDNQLFSFVGFSNPKESGEHDINNFRISVLKRLTSEKMAEITRTHVISGGLSSRIEAEVQTFPNTSQGELEQEESSRLSSGGNSVLFETATTLVDKQGETVVRSKYEAEEPRPHLTVRRIKKGVGGHNRGSNSIRHLVSFREPMPHKQLGIVGSMESPSGSRGHGNRENGCDICGQFNCTRLHCEGRGNQVQGALSASEGISLMGRIKEDLTTPSIYSGLQECSCGLPQQEGSDCGHRMVSKPAGLRVPMEDLGSSNDRSVRDNPQPSSSPILFPSFRSTGIGSGCNATKLGEQGGLRIPSLQHDSESSEQIERISQRNYDLGCAVVASEGVVSRPSKSGSRRTSKTTSSKRSPSATSKPLPSRKSPHASSNRLETLNSFIRARGFDREVAESIMATRRSSTNNSYLF